MQSHDDDDDDFDPADHLRAPPAKAVDIGDIVEAVEALADLVRQQQAQLGEVWQKAYGKQWKPSPLHRSTAFLANLLMRDLVERHSEWARSVDAEADVERSAKPIEPFPDHDDAIVSRAQVAQHLGISTATLDRLRQRGDFPKHTQISSRKVGWKAGDVRAWAGYDAATARKRAMGRD